MKEHQIRFIVMRYAEHENPEAIAIEFSDLYGEEITPKEVEKYDPARQENKERVGPFIPFYFEIRKTLMRKVVATALYKPIRLEKLRRMLAKAEAAQNVNHIIMIHEQIRKETDPVLKDLVKLMKISDGILAKEEYLN